MRWFSLRSRHTSFLALALMLCGESSTIPLGSVSYSQTASAIIINGRPLSQTEIAAIERLVGGRLVPGRYWYDRIAGLWGYEGGPPVGFALAGLTVGGALQADASRGTTRVFINGRELHQLEVAYLMTLGPVLPGRYVLNAAGYVSVEGQALPFAHLPSLHMQRWGSRASSSTTAGGASIVSGGGCLYITGTNSSGVGSWGASSGPGC